MFKQIERITFEASFHAGEYSVDGEAVSGYFPLNRYDGKNQYPFYYDEPAREGWLGYEVVEYHTGEISYTATEDGADRLAQHLAKSWLLAQII
jgi:hypothetical protein